MQRPPYDTHTNLYSELGVNISELQVGMPVPDFTLTTFEAESGDFGEVSLAKQKEEGRWTCLFFYPADFTFV